MAHDSKRPAGPVSRRRFLIAFGVGGAVALAGCSEGSGGSDGNPNDGSTDITQDGNGERDLSGRVRVSGSSTVYPVSVAASEEFRRQVSDQVEFSLSRDGSTGGFENFFLDGDSDINGSSRPILSLGRAIGETAPLIMVGAATTVFSPPTALDSYATAMPMQIFAWPGEFIADFRTGVLSAGVLTLLLAMLAMSAVAILLRNRYERGS